MTTPLILQIQQTLLDNAESVSDALMKAKVACFKLGLTEFGRWVDSEIEGYMNKDFDDLPEYRKLHGTPEAFNPYHGWQPIGFENAKQKSRLSLAPIGMTIGAIEHSMRDTQSDGVFSFPYPPQIENDMRRAMNWGNVQLRIRLTVPQVSTIVNKVRSILLGWTLEMEKQGVVGDGLAFSRGDKEKSAMVTEGVVNNIHIGQVGSFVQAATHSVVQGEASTAGHLASGVRDLVQQVGRMLPASGLPQSIQDNARTALNKLTEAECGDEPNTSRLRKGLEALKGALAPAGEHLLRVAVDAAITKLIGS